MNFSIGEYLKGLVEREGKDCLLDGKRVYGLLADSFPKYKREREIIRLAIRMGYPLRLEQWSKKAGMESPKVMIQQLAVHFCENILISYDGAIYALSILAYAKGYILDFSGMHTVCKADTLGCSHEKILNELFGYNVDVEDFKFMRKNTNEFQLLLGKFYLREKNMVKAYEWIQRAALNGNAEGQLQYGIMLQNGLGTEKNRYLALQWYRRSAIAGNKEALVRYRKLRPHIVEYV